MGNVIYKNYAKEYITQYNQAREFLKNLLWGVVFLKHSNNFLNNALPLSTIPIIEKICNDVKIVLNIRINSLLDEDKNMLKKLENAMSTIYIQKSHRNKFLNSLENLSWNSSEIANTRERLLGEQCLICDIENAVKSSYEYLERLAVDDACLLNYTQEKNNYEWLAGYFFELNDKHSKPISLF